MIDQIDRLGMPAAVEAENVNRSELDDRLTARELSHDRANHAAMRHQQRVAIARASIA